MHINWDTNPPPTKKVIQIHKIHTPERQGHMSFEITLRKLRCNQMNGVNVLKFNFEKKVLGSPLNKYLPAWISFCVKVGSDSSENR